MSTAVVEASTERRRQRNGQSFAGRVPASTTLFELFAALHTVVPQTTTSW